MTEIAETVKRGGGCYMMAHIFSVSPADIVAAARCAMQEVITVGINPDTEGHIAAGRRNGSREREPARDQKCIEHPVI